MGSEMCIRDRSKAEWLAAPSGELLHSDKGHWSGERRWGELCSSRRHTPPARQVASNGFAVHVCPWFSALSQVLRLGLPKLQWPIQLDCPRCHIPPYAWNASAVASYLHGTYCHPEASVRSCNDPTGGASTTALAAAVAGRLAFGGDLTSYLQLEAGEVAAVSSAFEGALGGNDFVYILLGAGCACLVVRWLTKGSGRRQKTASSWVRVNVTSSPTDHTRHGYSWAHGAVPRHSGDVENEVCCLLKHERGALELQ